MNTEFDIGNEVWYGYPNPVKGTVTRIIITNDGVHYEINKSNLWETVGRNAKEARIKGIKSDLATHKRYIAKLEKELEELEK